MLQNTCDEKNNEVMKYKAKYDKIQQMQMRDEKIFMSAFYELGSELYRLRLSAESSPWLLKENIDMNVRGDEFISSDLV